MVALPAGFQEEGKMTKMRLNTIVRIMAGVLLGLAMATIWMGSHPGPAYAQCGGNIAIETTISGYGGSKSCDYYFQGNAGAVVTISMTRGASALDPMLELYAPNGVLVASDDDSGGNYNSLILGYPLPSTGGYRIRTISYGGSRGYFDLGVYYGPAGGTGGGVFIDTVPSGARVTTVQVRSGAYVDAVQMGLNTGWLSKHGGDGGALRTFRLASGEYITSISGRSGLYLDQISFRTNLGRAYGPYGGSGGSPFSFQVPPGYAIVGLFGRSGAYVDAIGAIVGKLP
jgi:hypothetical protein